MPHQQVCRHRNGCGFTKKSCAVDTTAAINHVDHLAANMYGKKWQLERCQPGISIISCVSLVVHLTGLISVMAATRESSLKNGSRIVLSVASDTLKQNADALEKLRKLINLAYVIGEGSTAATWL